MATNGMTINGLNPLSALTADDKIPVWDTGVSGEPTKGITAQNMANSVKTLANLQGALTFDTTPTTGSTNPVTSDGVATAIQQSTAHVVGTVEIDLSGTAVTSADSGWYYAEIDASSYIPSGRWIIGIAMGGAWDANVFYEVYYARDRINRIIVRSSTSKTLGDNHKALLFYA